MQIPELPRFHFDLFGDLRDNYINGEIFTRIVDDKANIIIPQYGPFYVNSLVIKHPNGLSMVVDEDYEIVTIDPQLTLYTCKPVASMIRLLNASIGEGFLYYQCVGTGSPIDESVENMVEFLLNDSRPISFLNIKNRPSYYPPDLHKKSLRYSFYNFKSLIDLVNEGKTLLDRFHQSGLQAKEQRNAVLMSRRDELNGQLNLMLTNHEDGYNPHSLNAGTFGLEKVDNVPTANKRQALQALDNLRLTPEGLNEIIKTYHSNPNGLMPANILPIFHYGRDGFLPPSIDGAYLGNGFQYGCGAACLEPNGDLTLLRNRYNGRVRGLYYETIDNFVKGGRKVRFTSALFNSSVFKTDKAIIDSVVNGSNNSVLMVYDSTKPATSTYLINPNGSYDPRSQDIYHLDLTLVSDFNPNKGSIHEIGSFWIYIQFEDTVNLKTENALSGMKLYRCLKASSREGIVKFEPFIVDSIDLQGKVLKSNSYSFGSLVSRVHEPDDTDNLITDYIVKFPKPVDSIETCKTIAVQSVKKPKAGNVGVFHFHYGFSPSYINNGRKYSSPMIELQVIMELDIDNLSFKPTSENPPKEDLVFDWGNPLNESHYYAKTQLKSNYDPHPMIDDEGTTSTIFDKFRVLIFNSQGIGQDAIIYNFSPSLSTYEILSKAWGKNGNVFLKTGLNYPINSAFDVVSNCGFTAISDKFDLFYGLDGDSFKELLFSKVYDEKENGFALRDGMGILNKEVTSVYSRPLTNNIVRWSDKPSIPLINLSGDEVCLREAGLTVGELGFSIASTNQGLNYPNVNLEMNKLGLTLPILNQFNIGESGVSLSKEDQINFDQWMIDDLILNISGRKKVSLYDYAFDIFTFNGMNMNTVTSIPTIINLAFITGSEHKEVYMATALVNINLASDGVSVGGIEIIHKTFPSLVISECVNVKKSNFAPPSLMPMCMVGYLTKEGGNYSFEFKSNSSGYYETLDGVFSITTSGKFNLSDPTAFIPKYGLNDLNHQTIFGVIPKVGIKETVIPYREQAGGAAILLGTGNQTYLMSSTYVDKQFTLFFMGDEQVILSGGRYLLKSGSIDLRDVDPSPENKTFFVYAKLTNGEPVYHITLTELVQTPYCGLIAKVITNGLGIVNIERYHKFMIDGIELKG